MELNQKARGQQPEKSSLKARRGPTTFERLPTFLDLQATTPTVSILTIGTLQNYEREGGPRRSLIGRERDKMGGLETRIRGICGRSQPYTQQQAMRAAIAVG